MKKMLFIYNPNAGKGLLKPKLADVLDIFVKAGYEVVVYPTQNYRDAYRKVREYQEQYDLLVCSGGDGTLDEVVTGMMSRSERIPIGYIPSGSTNDFANSLHIPKDMLAAADTAVNGYAFSCDIGTFNRDIFVYIAAFGLFTDVSYETNQQTKNILGHLAYVLEGTKRLFNIPSYQLKIRYEDQELEGKFVFGMVTNSRSVGGFKHLVGKNIVFDDGVFEVTLIKTPKNAIELQDILSALVIRQLDSKYMYSFKTARIEFESMEEIPWTLDGEYGGSHDRVVIENKQRELQIMVPLQEAEALMEAAVVEKLEEQQ